MFAIDGAQFQVEAANVRSSIAQMADQLANDRPRKRLMSLIETHATTKSLPLPEDPVADGRARAAWSLRFNLAPRAFIPDAKDATRLGAVEFERTIVDPHNGRASGTGTTEHIPASLVFRSIGYEIIPVPGVPFDQQLNHVPHAQGRVTVDSSEGAAVISGLYVAGWLKRGPSGVIAATMYDAFQTAATIAADLAPSSDAAASSSLPVTLKPTREETIAWLTRVQPTRPVTFDDWKKIEAEERRRGEALGKPREKMTSLKEIYELLGIASDGPWNDAGGVKGNDDASRKEKK